ncbi:MAG: D-alanyl-D-alanine carboxypeptidase/D-alanyl-D-alanine-endopeptidase, partial [Bacteroidales bacterium]|nr:D-alanyl-D-alanine carboxypeptidase/D-alanyl-D-alanine-endopeptidase [Bacteroidales bacterium]
MKKIWILLFLVVMSAFTYSQTTSYDQLLDNLVAKTELKNASIGLYAENLNTGETIFNHNSEVSLVPASVFKILPTSIALELFGPEHTFKTELAYSGSIASDGSLNGNLYIIGYGDPCLGSTNYSNHYGDLISDWVSKIKQAGIKKINGDIIADASYFNRINIPNKWLWEDLANYYANPGSSLNYMDNLYLIHFQTGNIDGSPTKITKIVPNNLNLNIDNQVLSSSTTWDESFIFFGENKNDRIIKGTLPWKKSDFPIKGSITDPELYLTKVLNDALTSAGINISGNCK